MAFSARFFTPHVDISEHGHTSNSLIPLVISQQQQNKGGGNMTNFSLGVFIGMHVILC